MKTYTLERQQWIPRPLPEVFDFFSRAENLQRLTPPWMHFRILTPQPILMKPGALIDYKLRVHGLPVRWQTKIETWNPPFGFVDTQLKGPYRLWHHTHRFTEWNGGTKIDDVVRYALPFGVVGQLAHWLQVSRDLTGIFEYRSRIVRELFPAEEES